MEQELLEQARKEFDLEPSNKTAHDYMESLLAAELADKITDDQFHNGLADIVAYLHHSAKAQGAKA